MQNSYNLNFTPKGKPSVIHITMSSNRPVRVFFEGIDSDHPKTAYFRRSKVIRKKTVVEFTLPLSPNRLAIKVYSHGQPFSILRATRKPLDIKPIHMSDYVKSYIDFMHDFAQQASYLPTGNYLSDNGKHLIMYKESIDGRTPARVNRKTGRVKAAASMIRPMTVGQRVFVLDHEAGHHLVPTPDEVRADNFALRYHLLFKFPQTEANYAMTKVFSDNPFSRMRAKNMVDKIMLHDPSIAKNMKR